MGGIFFDENGLESSGFMKSSELLEFDHVSARRALSRTIVGTFETGMEANSSEKYYQNPTSKSYLGDFQRNQASR